MTREQWQRVKEVFGEAVDLESAQRVSFLDSACANDADLRSRVEALLTSDEHAPDSFGAPAVALAGHITASDSSATLMNWRAGAYRIVREIGQGGMGTVYLAERADGEYHKQVALKVLSTALNSDAFIRRFRTERQVLAILEHPNIARLSDGGATDGGVPYLVMEYVDGLPIDVWCDSHNVSLQDRLTIFRSVCSAVQYAHERQIVHRDIKPRNILVTSDGTAKLLDFGIAQVLKDGLSAPSMETATAAGLMTPDYASPEQVRGEAVGPASDVYALGLTLHVLATRSASVGITDRSLTQNGTPARGSSADHIQVP